MVFITLPRHTYLTNALKHLQSGSYLAVITPGTELTTSAP